MQPGMPTGRQRLDLGQILALDRLDHALDLGHRQTDDHRIPPRTEPGRLRRREAGIMQGAVHHLHMNEIGPTGAQKALQKHEASR